MKRNINDYINFIDFCLDNKEDRNDPNSIYSLTDWDINYLNSISKVRYYNEGQKELSEKQLIQLYRIGFRIWGSILSVKLLPKPTKEFLMKCKWIKNDQHANNILSFYDSYIQK